MQTGLIEAGENAISLYARTGIADEAPHLTLTRHLFGMSVVVSDKHWWDQLSPDDRAILEESFPAVDESRRATRAQNMADLADPALDFQTHDLTASQKREWQSATAGVAARLLESIGGRSAEIYELIQQGKAAYAGENVSSDRSLSP